MAEDAYQLLKILGIKNTLWIGQSMGGMIAQIMAVRYPHQVENWDYYPPVTPTFFRAHPLLKPSRPLPSHTQKPRC